MILVEEFRSMAGTNTGAGRTQGEDDILCKPESPKGKSFTLFWYLDKNNKVAFMYTMCKNISDILSYPLRKNVTGQNGSIKT